MKIQKLISISLGLCLILSSCTSNELTREKAEMLLKEFYKYPVVDTEKFGLSTMMGGVQKHAPLIRGGYLAVPRGSYIMVPDLEITSAGSVYYLDGQFATNTKQLKEVTGIKYEDEGKTKATIEFIEVKESITPFGEFLEYEEGEEIQNTVLMELYDDGWRISPTGKKKKILHLEDFPDVEEFIVEGE